MCLCIAKPKESCWTCKLSRMMALLCWEEIGPIKLLQASLATSSPTERLDVMLDKYSDVIENKLDTLSSAKGKLSLEVGS